VSSPGAPRSITGIVRDVMEQNVSAVSNAKAALAAIRVADRGDRGLNAFLSTSDDAALAAAETIDGAIAAVGAAGRLSGVPVALKDNLCTAGLPTTCGSRILDGYRSPYEATAVRRLRAAGAIIIGKTNMDEFAMGSSTENSAFGPTRNPHDPARVPGGSSGGSAAAVGAGLVPAALGSDTGGSVRQPASFCGVVGIKPTYGRVSRYGLVAFGSSLDQIGTFGRTVEDAALLLEIIAGHDARDSTSIDQPVPPLLHETTLDIDGMSVGVPAEYFAPGLDADVAALCRRAVQCLVTAGATVREVSLPHTRLAIPTYYVIATAEASSNLARYDGVRYGSRAADANGLRELYERTRSAGFGAEVKRRIMLGTFVLSAGYHDRYYGRAQQVRRLITDDFRRVFQSGIDVLFTPTTPAPPFLIGEKVQDPYQMYLSDVFTVTANLAGVPALSLPIGTVQGLPVGGQMVAAAWREDRMVRAAAALERALAA